MKLQYTPAWTRFIMTSLLLITRAQANQKLTYVCSVDPSDADGAIVTVAFIKGSDTVTSVDAYDYAAGDATNTANLISGCSLDTAAALATDRITKDITVSFTSDPVPCGGAKTVTGSVTTIYFLFRSSASTSLIGATDLVFDFGCSSNALTSNILTSQGQTPLPPGRITVLNTQRNMKMLLFSNDRKVPVSSVALGEDVFLSMEFFPSVDEGPDNCGVEFFMGFLSNDPATNVKLRLVVIPRYDVNTYVTVTTALETQEVTITSRANTIIELDPSLMACGDTNTLELEDKGVQLTSSAEVCVTVYNEVDNSQGRYTALPVDVLGEDYYTISASGVNVQTEVMVIATIDSTDVTLTLPVGSTLTLTYDGTEYTAGQPVTVTMDKRQTLVVCLESSTDVEPSGGIHVTSTSPVALICGNPSYGNTAISRLDLIVAQVPPTNRLGREYTLIPPVLTQDGRTVTYFIMAVEPGTTAVTRKDTGTVITLSSPGEISSVAMSSFAFELISDKAVLVAQLIDPPSNRNGDYDPSLVIFPARHQWAPQYEVFSAGSKIGIGVVFRNTEDVTNFYAEFSGSRVSLSVSAFPVQGNNNYLYGSVSPLAADTLYTIGSTSKMSQMMMITYSMPDDGTSGTASIPPLTRYGPKPETIANGCKVLPGKEGDLLDNDCDGRVDEEIINKKDDDGDGKIDEDTTASLSEFLHAVAFRPINCKASGTLDFTGATSPVFDLTTAEGCVVAASEPFHANKECLLVSGTGLEPKRVDCGSFPMKRFMNYVKVYFQCEILFCYSSSDVSCKTEICASKARRKRQSDDSNSTYLTTGVNISPFWESSESTTSDGRIDPILCLQNTSFQVAGILLIILFLISFIAAIFFCCQLRKQRKTEKYRHGPRSSRPSF